MSASLTDSRFTSSTTTPPSPSFTYPPTFPPPLRTLLTTLHTSSLTQEKSIPVTSKTSINALWKTDATRAASDLDALMLDKSMAIDNNKALFIHSLLLSTRATSLVEVGTSFGVSTIYLADAASQNAKASGDGREARVIGTEKEESKAQVAKRNWGDVAAIAGCEGLTGCIELRVGDLRETLREGVEGVEFVLLDIWPYVALPALELLIPHLKDGAVVITDNTVAGEANYKDLLAVLRNPDGPFQSVILPYDGGLEMSVYKPRGS